MIDALVLAIALAMDATAVAAARGLSPRAREAWLLPAIFGGAQAAMAALGWLLGDVGGAYVEPWDHWIAFVLLAAVGGKMLYEAWRGDDDDDDDATSALVYLALALATSIDSAAAGVTLPLLEVVPGVAIALIGVITLVASAIGYRIGRALGERFGRVLEAVGGIVLIGLAVRVLVENL